MTYSQLQARLRDHPKTWLITGAAGFIGSNILETLLNLGQRVVGLDNFVTGYARNLDDVRQAVGDEAWSHFTSKEGDIRNKEDLSAALQDGHNGVDYVLHHAAFVSVPGSLADPVTNNAVNVDGFLNVLLAAKEYGVKRVVYASSSAVYGDNQALPATEPHIGHSLSPYATSKYVNELYADLFARAYGVQSTGLRYFNIFGPRQDPNGAYAAVIPRWIDKLLAHERCTIFGDGASSRDFCFVENVVQANLLAATAEGEALSGAYNIGNGGRTTTLELYHWLRDALAEMLGDAALRKLEPRHEPPRPGDVAHSQADISKAAKELGYAPRVSVDEGVRRTLNWYAVNAKSVQT